MKIVLAKTAYSPLLKVAGDYSCGIFDATRQHGRAGAGSADPSRLDAGRGARGDRRLSRGRSRATCSSTTTPITAARTCPTSTSSRPPSAASGCSASAACARIGRISAARPRAATAPSPRSTARGCACRRCGSIATASPTRIEAIIFANVRTPAERQGDLRAQVAANRRAAPRLAALAQNYGADELLRIMDEVLDYSETMMRAALRALPDGEASFEDMFDGDGVLAPGATEDETVHGEADASASAATRSPPISPAPTPRCRGR